MLRRWRRLHWSQVQTSLPSSVPRDQVSLATASSWGVAPHVAHTTGAAPG